MTKLTKNFRNVCALVLLLMTADLQRARAANVMNYGADGNDYYQFTVPSMAFDKASGFTTLISFAMHVNPDGTLVIGGNVACTNGVYTGPANWGSLVATLKASPTTVTRYEVCVGGYGDTSYNDIESLVATKGTGPGSILYKNFQALKNAVPGIDAINDDDEMTYDLNSSTSFANMLGSLGYKFTMVPYTARSFWVNLYNNVTNCDDIYLQCYEGGAGNDPGQWDTAFGHGVVVVPGQESNTANPATFHNWFLETGVQGGFYYPDVVFNTTYWSAAVIEGNGALPGAPVVTAAVRGSNQVGLSWNTVPGAISYNVKRSTVSGGETTIGSVSAANNNWPASNQYTDTGVSTGTTYYYKVSAVNTNGEGLNSTEVSTAPQAASTWTGLGTDNNWGTSGNWNSAPNFPAPLIFAGSSRLTNTNNLNAIAVNSITFDAAAGAFVLNGNGITLNGSLGFNGIPAASINSTVNLNMAWPFSETIDTPANGNLTLGGDITSAVDTSLIKTDLGTLTLAGNNAITSWDLNGGINIITGNTTINGDGGSRIYVGDGDAIAGCNGALVIQPGAVLTIMGSFADTFVIGRDSGSGTIIQNGGTFNFNPANNNSLVIAATGDTRTRAEYDMNGGLLNMGGNNLTVGWGNLTVTGALYQASGVITNLALMRIPFTGGGNGLGIYTLSGGSIYLGANGIITDGARYAINLGGGTVGAYASWSSSLKMNLTNLNGSVTFDTSANTITLSGTLSGSGGLTKIGSGTLELSGTNTYTGNTIVNGGTLKLDSTGIHQGALSLGQGTLLDLNFSGSCVVSNCSTNGVALPAGTYNAGNLPGFIIGAGNLQAATHASTGRWTGLGANNNWSTSGNWDQNAVPVFPIGLTFAGSSQLASDNDLLGITANSMTFDSAAGAFVLSGNPITLAGNLGFNANPIAPVTQTVNLGMTWTANETIDTPTNGNLILGGAINSGNDLAKLDAGMLTLAGTNAIESLDVNGGVVTIAGKITLNGNQGSGNYDRFYLGDGDTIPYCNGALIIQPGAALTVTGNFNDTFVIGRDGGSGTVIQNGGTFTFNPANISLMLVGASDNPATRSEYDMNGGLWDMKGNTLVVGFGDGVVTTGIVNQVGGVITNLYNLAFYTPTLPTGLGYGFYTLSGGSIYLGAGGITTSSGTYAINLGGGTVGAYANWSSPLNMNLTNLNGSVTFDTAENSIALWGVLSGNSGLIKTGTGTLELGGVNTYTGDTTVNAGTLQLDVAGNSPGAFHLVNGAMLDLNFSGSYVVAACYTNNIALPDGDYNATSLPGFITGAGVLKVGTIPTAPTNIGYRYSLTGSNVAFSWPSNYLGWILQEQINPLNIGLSTNWVDVAGSEYLTSTNIPINPGNPACFYRLCYPLTAGALPALTRQIFVTNNLLNLPVKNGGTMRRFTIVVGGKTVQDFDIELADGTPDWWAFVDLTPFQGQTANLSVNDLPPGSTGLSSIVQTNGIMGATNLYQETLRPQVHFSCKRGIFNDVNGLVYYQGQYNLYYQHNPYGLSFSYAVDGAQRNWGHAVSTDLVHWQELPDAIYPHSYGDYVWSGSAAIDSANTGGFKTGTNDVIVASYYSLARGECLAYSNDGGLTFSDYTNNPIIVNVGRDPHILWYAPSNYWVIAVYDATGGNGISFYSSPNLRQWTYRSKIYGFYECPDLFQMPVDGNTNNMLWELNDGSGGYMLGQFNGAAFTPATAKIPNNLGSGFYASQTFTTMPAGDTRRVRIGWAQIAMPGMPFNQMHYFPTELTLQTTPSGVLLCSQPIQEIQNLVGSQTSWTNLNLSPGSNPLSGISGTEFDLKTQFTPGGAQSINFTFQGATVVYNTSTQQISCNGITNSLPPNNGVVQLEIIVDLDSIEIFGNNGQLYMPMPANNATGNSQVSLSCTGGTATFNSLTVSKLNSCWTQP